MRVPISHTSGLNMIMSLFIMLIKLINTQLNAFLQLSKIALEFG